MINKYKDLFLQFFKFGIVGILNVCVNFITYYVLLFLGIHYIIANTVGYILGIVNSYYWNNRYVFLQQKQDLLIKKFIKVCVSYGITYIISTIALYVIVSYLNISEIIAPILILFITVPINFILNKYWAFKAR